VEARLLGITGSTLIGLVILLVFFPALLIYPGIAVLAWMGGALLYRALKLYMKGKHSRARVTSPAIKEATGTRIGKPEAK